MNTKKSFIAITLISALFLSNTTQSFLNDSKPDSNFSCSQKNAETLAQAVVAQELGMDYLGATLWESNKAQQDAQTLQTTVSEACIKNKENSRDGKFHEERVRQDAQQKLRASITILLERKIEETNPEFACIKQEVAQRIINANKPYDCIGKRADETVRKTLEEIRQEQANEFEQAQRRRSKPPKSITSCTVCGCKLESESWIVQPCGHTLCHKHGKRCWRCPVKGCNRYIRNRKRYNCK